MCHYSKNAFKVYKATQGSYELTPEDGKNGFVAELSRAEFHTESLRQVDGQKKIKVTVM